MSVASVLHEAETQKQRGGADSLSTKYESGDFRL